MLDRIITLIDQNHTLLWLLTLGTVAFFVLSVLSLPLLVRLIPMPLLELLAAGRIPPPKADHPGALIARNLLGGVLVLGGLVMLVLPGQGVLTIAAGLLLMSFPGKRALLERALAQPRIHHWLTYHLARRREREASAAANAITEDPAR